MNMTTKLVLIVTFQFAWSSGSFAEELKKTPAHARVLQRFAGSGSGSKASVTIILACPVEDKSKPCRIADDIKNLPAKEVGLTLLTTGDKAIDIQKRAANQELSQATIKKLISTQTFNALPENVGTTAAAWFSKAAKSAKLKAAGASARLAGVVILSYAAWHYLFVDDEQQKKK